MKIIPVKTVYLEMTQESDGLSPGSPNANYLIMRAKRPTVAFYRFLYDSVGRSWFWVDRQKMNDEELGKILKDEQVEIFVFYVDGTPAGYAELDRRIPCEIELAYFGLMPEFIGRGLGKYLLRWVVKKAWEYQPVRLWLHTCELDHPAALPNYLKAGFEVYDTKIIQQEVPE